MLCGATDLSLAGDFRECEQHMGKVNTQLSFLGIVKVKKRYEKKEEIARRRRREREGTEKGDYYLYRVSRIM